MFLVIVRIYEFFFYFDVSVTAISLISLSVNKINT